MVGVIAVVTSLLFLGVFYIISYITALDSSNNILKKEFKELVSDFLELNKSLRNLISELVSKRVDKSDPMYKKCQEFIIDTEKLIVKYSIRLDK